MEAIKEKTTLEKLTLGLAALLTLVQLAVLMDCFNLTNLLWLLAAGALTCGCCCAAGRRSTSGTPSSASAPRR